MDWKSERDTGQASLWAEQVSSVAFCDVKETEIQIDRRDEPRNRDVAESSSRCRTLLDRSGIDRVSKEYVRVLLIISS